MNGITVTARLFTEAAKPAANKNVTVQAFIWATGRWSNVGRGRSNASGNLSVKVDPAAFVGGKGAPTLRVIEAGNPAPRVLSGAGMMRFDARRKTLFVDFGEIELLGDQAFKRPNTDTGQANTADTVAGMPRKPGLSQAVVMHNLTVNRGLTDSIAISRQPANTLTIAPAAAGPARAALTDQQTAIFVSKEVEALRVVTIQKDAVISEKNQALTTATASLTASKAEVTDLRGKLANLKTRAETAEATAAAHEKAAGTPADVQTVLTGLGTKLSDANSKLKAQALPFRLGAVKIDLRGHLSPTGEAIVMGGADKGASGVSTELHLDTSTASAATVKVPDLSGLTEAAARRVARSVGLRLTTSFQPLPTGKGTPGQALTQHPAAGQSAEHGAEVLVVFGMAQT